MHNLSGITRVSPQSITTPPQVSKAHLAEIEVQKRVNIEIHSPSCPSTSRAASAVNTEVVHTTAWKKAECQPKRPQDNLLIANHLTKALNAFKDQKTLARETPPRPVFSVKETLEVKKLGAELDLNLLKQEVENLLKGHEPEKPSEEGVFVFKDANLVAEKNRLSLLLKTIETNPELVKNMLVADKDSPAFKNLGALKFISYVLVVKENFQNAGKQIPEGLTNSQIAAIHCYTTKEGIDLMNSALRAGAGVVKDPSLRALIDDAKSGMQKLPEINGPLQTVYRGIATAPTIADIQNKAKAEAKWREQNLAKGGIYMDHAFGSCMTVDYTQGVYKLTIHGLYNARDISLFSAFPKEQEVVFLPGTKFRITEAAKDSNASTYSRFTLVPLKEKENEPIFKSIYRKFISR